MKSLAEYLTSPTDPNRIVVLVTDNVGELEDIMFDLRAAIGSIGHFQQPYSYALTVKSNNSRFYIYPVSKAVVMSKGLTLDVLLMSETLTSYAQSVIRDEMWCAVRAGGTIATFRRT